MSLWAIYRSRHFRFSPSACVTWFSKWSLHSSSNVKVFKWVCSFGQAHHRHCSEWQRWRFVASLLPMLPALWVWVESHRQLLLSLRWLFVYSDCRSCFHMQISLSLPSLLLPQQPSVVCHRQVWLSHQFQLSQLLGALVAEGDLLSCFLLRHHLQQLYLVGRQWLLAFGKFDIYGIGCAGFKVPDLFSLALVIICFYHCFCHCLHHCFHLIGCQWLLAFGNGIEFGCTTILAQFSLILVGFEKRKADRLKDWEDFSLSKRGCRRVENTHLGFAAGLVQWKNPEGIDVVVK